LNGRILLWVSAILMCQLHVTSTLAEQAGIASVYSTESGSKTASGQNLNPEALTAAHRSLPFGTKVRVTNKKNGNSVIVTINDRGPFIRNRIIDVTPAGARALGFSGLTQVTLRIDDRIDDPVDD
jgi:rare lipoprotein A